MYKKIRWIFILVISTLTTAILITGFFYSISITNRKVVTTAKDTKEKQSQNVNKQSTKVKELNSNYYNILVMGDSLAKGTGDDSGKGFAKGFGDLMKSKESKPINITNIGINGDTSSGLLNVLNDEQNLKYAEQSKIIFISIGGNEIKGFKSAGTSIENRSNMNDVENKYFNNLQNVFKIIRSRNKNSTIVFIGLYNPFGNNINSDKIKFLADWNSKTDEFVSQDTNAVFIPTYDLFKYNMDSYLAGDDFHPNTLGYEAISKRIFEALKNYKN